MSRDDSMLSTGLSSAVSRRQEAKKAEAAKVKEQLTSRLKPEATIILDWIEAEKQKVMSVSDIDPNSDNVQAQLIARKMHYDFCIALGNSARIVLGRKVVSDE